jgi:hypothetical protein
MSRSFFPQLSLALAEINETRHLPVLLPELSIIEPFENSIHIRKEA